MSKSVWAVSQEQIKTYGTKDNKFSDFPIGTRVKVITLGEDMNFFYGETGKVIRNSGKYLGIIVEFDEPRRFKDGYIQTEFNFKPSSICHLDEKCKKIAARKAELANLSKEAKEQELQDEERSERFMLMDL